MSDKTFLVVGADSLVGSGLQNALAERGCDTYATTRRVSTLSPLRLFLDFEKYQDFISPQDVAVIYVVAAATNYNRCETDPLARTTNVELIPNFVEDQLRRGLFVCFVSTNSVFGGERPWPEEDDPHSPKIAYAQQKSEGEAAIIAAAMKLGAQSQLAIVRLTKVLDLETPPLPEWFAKWSKEEIVKPFEDLIFAPISVKFVANALARLGELRIPGNFHLSGAENLSYVTLAKALADASGITQSLITPTTAGESGIEILFKPTYSGLGMRRTTKLTGIHPQSLDSVIADLISTRKLDRFSEPCREFIIGRSP